MQMRIKKERCYPISVESRRLARPVNRVPLENDAAMVLWVHNMIDWARRPLWRIMGFKG